MEDEKSKLLWVLDRAIVQRRSYIGWIRSSNLINTYYKIISAFFASSSGFWPTFHSGFSSFSLLPYFHRIFHIFDSYRYVIIESYDRQNKMLNWPPHRA
jgi:hypothetical protein